ncbi:ATP-binding protein [Burkholderia gladioli]|uniref:ATP-binding protein n=1 Tax=Burkholderia gladioli TaxID=28095 RepID=UPI00163F58F0|nr:ATP-binding protein [Burkholderia gladioli]
MNTRNLPTVTLANFAWPNVIAEQTIQNLLSNNSGFPTHNTNGILLYGEPGTGKTPLARLLPDAIEAKYSGNQARATFTPIKSGQNNVELNSSIFTTGSLSTLGATQHHYFVLDEIDNLTDDAMKQFMLVMNQPDTVFVMTTNNFSAVSARVRGRCKKIKMSPDSPDSYVPWVRSVLQYCGVTDPKMLSSQWIKDEIIEYGNNVREILSRIDDL